MTRKHLAAVVVFLGLVGPARADAIRIQLDLEGTLSVANGGTVLSIEGEGTWTLDLPDYLRQTAKEILDKRPNAKVAVQGTARVASFGGNTLAVADRTVRVAQLSEMYPGVRVATILQGTPAVGNLKPGDVIREVNGQEIHSYQRLLEILGENRGKAVKIVLSGAGASRVVTVRLNPDGVALGVTGETVWTAGGAVVGQPAPPPGKDSEKP